MRLAFSCQLFPLAVYSLCSYPYKVSRGRQSCGFAFSALILVGVVTLATPVQGNSHSWAPWEFHSNASGTVQFIELYNPTDDSELFIGNRFIRSVGTGNISDVHRFPPGMLHTRTSTCWRGPAAFAALPGAPTLDFPPLIDNFFDMSGDTIRFWNYVDVWSAFTFGARRLAARGAMIRCSGTVTRPRRSPSGWAQPTNFAGDTFLPPGVPDSGVQLLVEKLSITGGTLNLQWDDGACFGRGASSRSSTALGSNLPAVPGGTYTLQPENPLGMCNIQASPKSWLNVPDPASDSSRFMWFLVLANDGGLVEGSWGTDSAGNQRQGSGGFGASAQCGHLSKSLVNTCGH